MNLLQHVKELARIPSPEPLLKAVREGSKVMGYFCCYTPEEIITAAGMVPYRMRAVGAEGTAQADSWFSALNCSVARHIFDQALRGKLDFLDGLVFSNTCDNTRRMCDNWRAARTKPAFIHFLGVPHVSRAHDLRYYQDELSMLVEALEKAFSVNITAEALQRAMELHKQKRALMQDIWKERQRPDTPLRASDGMALVQVVSAMPVQAAIQLLGEYLEEARSQSVTHPATEVRVLVMGGGLEDPAHLDLIESMGARLVDDLLCFGRRHFEVDVLAQPGEEPLTTLARAYLTRLSCPRMMDGWPRRMQTVRHAVEQGVADAVILEAMKFCLLWAGEASLTRTESANAGFPLLVLEREYNARDEGQVKTRVQAFLEQVRVKRGARVVLERTP